MSLTFNLTHKYLFWVSNLRLWWFYQMSLQHCNTQTYTEGHRSRCWAIWIKKSQTASQVLSPSGSQKNQESEFVGSHFTVTGVASIAGTNWCHIDAGTHSSPSSNTPLLYMDGRQSSEETVTITSRSWVHIRVKNHRWQRSGGRTSSRAAHQSRARHNSRPQSEPQIARFKGCTLREKPWLPILAIIDLCGYSCVQSAFAHPLHYHQHNPCYPEWGHHMVCQEFCIRVYFPEMTAWK